MAVCELCGNDYDKAFEVVTHDGAKHIFDSFECVIHLLAPTCSHCGCRVMGHGLESDGAFYCCAHCARHSGEKGLVDRTLVKGSRIMVERETLTGVESTEEKKERKLRANEDGMNPPPPDPKSRNSSDVDEQSEQSFPASDPPSH